MKTKKALEVLNEAMLNKQLTLVKACKANNDEIQKMLIKQGKLLQELWDIITENK